MRVAFFADTPHRLAGAQKSLLLSLSRLAQFGVEPIVTFPFSGILEEKCRSAGVRTQILEAPPAFTSFGRALTRLSASEKARLVFTELLPYARRLARFCEKVDAKVIHFNTPRGITMTGASAAMSGLPAALHVRGVPLGLHRAYWITSQMLADSLILVAEALRQYVHPSALPRTRVVYNGVVVPPAVPKERSRLALVKALRARGISIPDESTIFACVSSPTPFKGLHHLADAAAAATARGLDATFLCAGAGNGDHYESWLRERIERSGISSRLHLLGFYEDVAGLLAGADALVLPSVESERLQLEEGVVTHVRGTEGLPRAILESFAVGTPVIATSVAGVREQVEDGASGVIVPPGDVPALAEALLRVASTPEWRAVAGQRGRDEVQSRFTVDAAARGLSSCLRDLGARGGPSMVDRVARTARLLADRQA